MRIFYSPTPTNRLFAIHAKRDERLKMHSFIPLSENPCDRILELGEIKGKSAFIWGDGHAHDESYHFSIGAGRKVLVDQHEDNLDFHGTVTFSNHMTAWEKSGSPASTYTIHGYKDLGKSLSVRRMERLLRDDLAVSVDCDCLSRFPAMPYWTLTQMKGFSVEDVVFFVSYLASSTSRFDIGGLPEGVEGFNYGPGFELPTMGQINSYCYHDGPLPQKTKDAIYSYAFNAYRP